MGSAGGVQVPDFDRTAPDPKAIRASTIFLCFNQQDSVTDAFGSLLAQTVPLEIVASDDASRDGTFERLYAMAREHRGPHAIRLYRQRRNLGIGANFRFCAGRTTQRYIVLFEGDDWSEPHRVDRLLELARRHPKARMYGSSLRLIGADGMESTWRYVQIERGEIGLSGDWVIRGACFMVDRELIDRFPPIPRRAVAVDLLLNLRALRHFGLESRVVCPEPLVRYRMAERGRRAACRRRVAGPSSEAAHRASSAISSRCCMTTAAAGCKASGFHAIRRWRRLLPSGPPLAGSVRANCWRSGPDRAPVPQ